MEKAVLRISILQDKISSQNELERLLEKRSKKTNEISISESLEGSIDLKILSNKGFKKINHVMFSPGRLTHISNFPDGITHFVCEDNLLENVDHLPDTIVELNVSHNLLKSIDLSRFQKLKVLHVEHNDIRELNGLPESLEELHCSYNQIEKLDLKNTPALRVLKCQGNIKLVLSNMPDTIVESQLPENITIDHFENSRKQPSKSYDEYVKQYYQIKSKYETKLKEIQSSQINKKRKKMRKPNCVGCGKPVGMIFSRKDDKFTAICGNNPPCDWKIIIHRGYFSEQNDTLETFMRDMDELKQRIICHKLNTVFEYISEDQSAKLFEKEIELFNATSKQVTELLDIYNSKYHNIDKEEKINQKRKKIQELLLSVKEALNNRDVEQAVKIQYENVAPLAKSIQHESYEVNHIESYALEKGIMREVETDDEPGKMHFLVQSQIVKEKIDENLTEPVSVEHFGKKKM